MTTEHDPNEWRYTDDELGELVTLCNALAGHRWPWAPLGDLLGGSLGTQGDRLGVDSAQVCRWRRAGLTDAMADRCAIRLGRHPREVWPGWDHVGQADEHQLDEAA